MGDVLAKRAARRTVSPLLVLLIVVLVALVGLGGYLGWQFWGTNVLAAAVLSGAGLSIGSYLPLALAMSCFYMAGMCFNDVCDREIDRLTQARRPLPSGRISLRRAIGLTCALFGLGLGLLGLDGLGLDDLVGEHLAEHLDREGLADLHLAKVVEQGR